MNKLTQNKDGSLTYDSGNGKEGFGKAEIIAYIDKKFKPIYWIIGVAMLAMLSIFVTIALPLQNNLIEVIKNQQNAALSKDVDAKFINKWDYYQIEVDEHRLLKTAIQNPIQADYIMGVINDNIETRLLGKFTTRGGTK